MNPLNLITTRQAILSDEAFIFSSWLLGLYYGDSWYSKLDKDYFMKYYHKVIEQLLSTSTIKIACLKEDPNTIIGFSVFDEDKLHWVTCKKDWRRIGVASLLVPREIKVVTHANKVGLEIAKKKDLDFQPFHV